MQADGILNALLTIASPDMALLLLGGMAVGTIFGVLPGLGGRLGLVFLIPFTFGMDPTAGLIFLLSMHAVVHTSGAFPSIIFGIPGTGPDAATMIDGYPMALNGEVGRALGATLAASAAGGIIGAVYLSLFMPFASMAVMAFGPAEQFMFAMFGIAFIACLSGQDLMKGIAVGLFGLAVSTIRLDPLTAEDRFTFGQLFLWDGIDVVTAVMAVFAVPEIITFTGRVGDDISKRGIGASYSGVWKGCTDVVRHWWLTLRTSVIGALIGMIPGLGGDVATWVCYGHAVQTSATPERFGKGAVEGVIAPETANNSKEGGALLPTMFFGMPGSASMAILLGGLVALGLQPGPQILAKGGQVVWVMIWTLAIANVVTAAILLMFTPWLAWLASKRTETLMPAIALLSFSACYMASGAWQNIILFLGLGLVSCLLKAANWPRTPFAIGVVLGPIAEVSLHKSLMIWGLPFLMRPIVLVLIACTCIVLAAGFRRNRRIATP